MAIFMDIPGIEGESTHDTVPNWDKKVQIFSVTYDVSQKASLQTGTGLVAAGGKLSHVSISKTMDKSTPFLWNKLCMGEPLDYMFLRFTRSAGAQGVYENLTVTLEKVLITDYHTSGQRGAGGMPVESISFSVGAITETYDVRDERGMKVGQAQGGYDFMQNSSNTLQGLSNSLNQMNQVQQSIARNMKA